ncbi:MAG: S41 family peptidase [Planctomycetia bacterium]|nr:S41 family peptidase [Planctomycetia bacterium]
MFKILHCTLGILGALALCPGVTSGQAPSQESGWRPTSTVTRTRENSAVNALNGRIPTLRQLEATDARDKRSERAVSLNRAQSATDALSPILAEGQALMQRGQWYQAKKLFEKSLRKYPENAELQAGFAQARRRYEISIRYQDASFASLARRTPLEDMIIVFDEVMADVEAYHVDRPANGELFSLGLSGLSEALYDESFLRLNEVSTDQRDRAITLIGDTREKSRGWNLCSAEEMKRATLWLARQLRRETGVSETLVLSEFLCSMICSLDAYSASLTPIQVEDVFSLIDGRFVGIGVELKSDAPTTISRVIPGSPAQECGVMVGDKIIKIDGQVTEGLSGAEIGELLQGEEGELATLELEDVNGSLRHTIARRRAIDVPSVENVHMLDAPGRIAYAKISCFQKTTATEMLQALRELEPYEPQALTLDLRQNPGGLLQEAINLSDVFLSSGVIVQTKGRNGEHSFDARSVRACELPLVILVDNNSASAAEIFAGAMQENGRALIVGTQSYGKGTVQAIIQLKCSTEITAPIAGVRLTTEKFYSPNGRAYGGVGVLPNVDVERLAQEQASRAVTMQEVSHRDWSTHGGSVAKVEERYGERLQESGSRSGRIFQGFESFGEECQSDITLATAARVALQLETQARMAQANRSALTTAE